MNKEKKTFRNPWWWVPSLYYAEGIPYVIVMTVSVIMYKRLGISNTDIALYTSWLYLPWVIKPLWSPVVDLLRTKRFWIVTMQLIVGAGLAGVALTIPIPNFFQYTLAFFWLLAFSSATHDIAADGFYMLGLTKHQQAFYVGIRSTFYRFAMITGQGLLIILAGYFEATTGLPSQEIEVLTKTGTAQVQFMDPESVPNEPLEGEIRIVTFPDQLEINATTVPRVKVDSVLNASREWNHNHEFYKPSEEEISAATEMVEEPSWWSKYVVTNIENFLRKNFGVTEEVARTDDLAGNVGVIYFRLSKEPVDEDEIVVNFGFDAGDKSIALIEGTRFIFTKDNWNIPAAAVFQIDSKLENATKAEFKATAGNIPLAWIITFTILAILFVVFFVYHKFILPYPKSDVPAVREKGTNVMAEFFRTFALFFKKKYIGVILGFLLLFRFGEAQLVKIAPLFMVDATEFGGLGLTTGEFGLLYGTVGLISLTLGGIFGGILAAKYGLKYWLWWMVIAMNIPNLVWVYLSATLPESYWIIGAGIGLEQFGYGFGFTAYMLYMIYVSEGDHKTSHYAIATGFMALGMMIPGMFSGWLQEIIGYNGFFVWVMLATIPAFIITYFIPLDPEFGKKSEEEESMTSD